MLADGKNKYLQFGNNADVVRNVVGCYRKWRLQPQDIVSELHGLETDDICYSLFKYVLANVRYKEDTAGYQFIKSPARLLHDGEGDCKSMTIFIASCLYCLGIPHILRFVGFDNSGQYTHVYPVAIDEGGNEIIIDCVERDSEGRPVYNYARAFVTKKDIISTNL